VTKDDKVEFLGENQSTYIAIGKKHRLANPGAEPALLIEVQSGEYIGEDDTVRFEDAYGRGADEYRLFKPSQMLRISLVTQIVMGSEACGPEVGALGLSYVEKAEIGDFQSFGGGFRPVGGVLFCHAAGCRRLRSWRIDRPLPVSVRDRESWHDSCRGHAPGPQAPNAGKRA
jgi:hypothetical protein